jgi:hypothetical protein
MHALLALLAGGAMLYWREHAALLSFMLLAQLGAAGFTVAAALNLFGGHALNTVTTRVVLIAVFALTMLSLLIPSLAWGNQLASWTTPLLTALATAWLALGVAIYRLIRRGWYCLCEQPHPFLVA